MTENEMNNRDRETLQRGECCYCASTGVTTKLNDVKFYPGKGFWFNCPVHGACGRATEKTK